MMHGLKLWWGRRQNSTILFTILFLNGPGLLFLIGEWPFMQSRVSVAVSIIFLLLLIFANATLYATTFSDPGFLPKNLHAHLNPMLNAPPPPPPPPPPADPQQLPYPFFVNLPQLHAREIEINGQLVRLKFCETCNIFRPPRCSHCGICDRCIMTHDHHCPWVANCIGKFNYQSFFLFVTSAAILCVYGFSFSLAHLIITGQDLMASGQPSSIVDVIVAAPISFSIVLFTFMLSFNLFGFALYHLVLITRNLTTHEKIKQDFSFDRPGNPFQFPSKWENYLRINIIRRLQWQLAVLDSQ